MAPEILLKHKYDARVDLWSVGVIMYECLFGRAPYSSGSFQELAEKIKGCRPIEVIIVVFFFFFSFRCVSSTEFPRIPARSPRHCDCLKDGIEHLRSNCLQLASVSLRVFSHPTSTVYGLLTPGCNRWTIFFAA